MEATGQMVFGRRRLAIVGTVLAALIAAGGAAFGWLGSAGASPQSVKSVTQAESSQVAPVEALFTAAMQAAQSAGSPPAAYITQMSAAIQAHGAPSVVPNDVRQSMLAAGQRTLAQYFSGQPLQREEAGLRNMLQMDADPNQINLGAGVAKVQFVTVAVKGGTAIVVANVTAYAKSYVRQSPQAPWLLTNPVNTMHFIAGLTLTASGRWVISSLQGDFVPGEGP